MIARDQVRDLLHDHARLAAAGAREHQQGALAVQDGGALGGVETVHGDIEGRRAGMAHQFTRLSRRGRVR